MITRRSCLGLVAVALTVGRLAGQASEVVLTRPGQIVITAISGEAQVSAAGQRRAAKVEDRVKVDSVVTTGRRSLATLVFSNGVVAELGPESEVEIEELLQAPFAAVGKPEAMTEEPSLSRTRVRLLRGEVRLAAKPLKVARGSAFVVVVPAGEVRLDEGALQASVRMSDVGLGVCAIELQRGTAQFERAGGAAAEKLNPGRRLTLAVEIARAGGEVKVSEMPPAKE
ncbi:MAG: FecR domain-containing protein [Verrucomicrobia bacterium]|nr:FecR domain-containing protein [Verrucomicrobiota bacterium]